jgi:predicted alpha/beta-fold hydrolase
MSALPTLAGHFWTIAPVLRHRARPAIAPAATEWSTELPDERLGTIRLRGLFRERPTSDTAVIVVHGLGGTTITHYCLTAARAADAAGLACLRLALRGADRDGEDLYHGGVSEDLHAAVASPALARFRRIYVLAFSLGGHVALRYALAGGLSGAGRAPRDPRVRAVAAICSPLDLELGAQHIDSPAAVLYRRHVLTGLKAMYVACAARRKMPAPVARVLAVRTIREWDSLTVVPRYDFSSVESYYAQMSVGPKLADLELPALLVSHPHDPMVPPWTYERHLAHKLPSLEHRLLSAGGHVGYPPGIDLGEQGARGVEAQALSWLLRH